MNNSTLDNFTLQIISKYIYDFKTINNLLKLNKSFSELYHTTFEIINLNCYYILSDKQVKNIIDKLINTFPNLEEIILNFNGTDCIDFDDFNNCILANYLKFYNYSQILEKPIKIKIQFDFKIKFNTYDFYKNFSEYLYILDFNLYILSKLIEKDIIILKNIYVLINCCIYYNDLNILDDIYKSFMKIKLNKNLKNKINLIVRLDKYMPFHDIPDEYKNIDGFYFSYYIKGVFHFNNINDKNVNYINYQPQIKDKSKLWKYIISFPVYYEIMKNYNNELKKYKNRNLYMKIKTFIKHEIDKIYDLSLTDEYIRKYFVECNGKIYKSITVSNNVKLCLNKNGKYYVSCDCSKEANNWHFVQSEILEYFNVNDNYEL